MDSFQLLDEKKNLNNQTIESNQRRKKNTRRVFKCDWLTTESHEEWKMKDSPVRMSRGDEIFHIIEFELINISFIDNLLILAKHHTITCRSKMGQRGYC